MQTREEGKVDRERERDDRDRQGRRWGKFN